jgi:dTDP-4-dehydrorhamnose 3,5-epimerase
MNLVNTGIRDLLILEPKVFTDSRGYFFESYNKNTLGDFIGKKYNFVQENEFKSSYGVIRWLHYQLAPYSQVKFVRERMGYASGRAPDVIKLSRT